MSATSYVADAQFLSQSAGRFTAVHEQLAMVVNQLIALLLLALFSPMMVIIIVLVWQTDGAPVFYAHYRVGRGGKLFRCLKFRSMRVDSATVLAELLKTNPAALAEWKRDQKLADDPRITPVGRFIRKTSLDELPQLFNVLCGEMHLVGPRPVTVAELTRYGAVRWHYVSVPPGITGLWQVSGRNNTTYAQRVSLDRQYVESRSAWVDATILAKTVRVVLMREGAR